ncbi:MAG: hypothetical protein ACRDZZ_09210, partial [Ilumatobacteraceae bacterium]
PAVPSVQHVIAHLVTTNQWDAWIHERDIVLPLGRTPVEEVDEITACLTYGASLRGPAVELVEALAFRVPLPCPVAEEHKWLLNGLATVFDREP